MGQKGRPMKLDLSTSHHYSKSDLEGRERVLEMFQKTSLPDIKCPKNLTGEARKVFKSTVENLKKKNVLMLEEIDIPALVMYSEAIAQYRRLSKQLSNLDKKFDALSRKKKKSDDEKEFCRNYYKTASLIRAEMRKEIETYMGVNEQFILTPVGRIKMGLKTIKEQSTNPVESLLKRMLADKKREEPPVIDVSGDEVEDKKTESDR